MSGPARRSRARTDNASQELAILDVNDLVKEMVETNNQCSLTFSVNVKKF